ncbi:restriction endonuclease subunit S, partial [Roseibium sp.]|uniref:restriction endonuclease subunit S n=1 Tax=Roseibium sp. TaxID=1936156 RepID=UPI001B0AB030
STSWLSETGAKSQKKQLLAPGSVSVSCIATPGLVAINPHAAMTNQQINSVEAAADFSTEFVYWSCVQAAQEVLVGGSGGSVFHNTNKSTFSAISIMLGSSAVRQDFSEIVRPWHEKILGLDQENQTLANLRDTLLPRFMSGELRVGEAREQVEDVA